MVDYSTQNITEIIEKEDLLACNCGGAQLQYFNKAWEESLKNPLPSIQNQKQQSQAIIDENEENLLSKMG